MRSILRRTLAASWRNLYVIICHLFFQPTEFGYYTVTLGARHLFHKLVLFFLCEVILLARQSQGVLLDRFPPFKPCANAFFFSLVVFQGRVKVALMS
jgi:hypothetical protein